MNTRDIEAIICKDEAIKTGLGKTLIHDIARRIHKLSVKESFAYRTVLKDIATLLSGRCGDCIAGAATCPEATYQKRVFIDGPCPKRIFKYLMIKARL